MKLPVISTAPSVVKGIPSKIAKQHLPKSEDRAQADDRPDAKVMQLFPKHKALANSGAKGLKFFPDNVKMHSADASPDPTKLGHDFFGSLYASLECRLENPPSENQDSTNEVISPVMGTQDQKLPWQMLTPTRAPLQHDISSSDDEGPLFKKAAVPDELTLAQSPAPRSISNSGREAGAVAGGALTGMAFQVTRADAESAFIQTGLPDSRPKENQLLLGTNQQAPDPIDASATKAAFAEIDQSQNQNFTDDADQQPADQFRAAGNRGESTLHSVSSIIQIPAIATGAPGPVAQIVENIRDALVASPTKTGPDPANLRTAPTRLQFELQPEGLGAVTIILKSTQGKLKIDIAAKLDATRQELERGTQDLVNGLRTLDGRFQDIDVVFLAANQGSGADLRERTIGHTTPHNVASQDTSSFASSGGQDANQSGASHSHGHGRMLGARIAVRDESSSVESFSDGIYL